MIIYVNKADYRSFGSSPELWGGDTLEVEVPDDFQGGAKTYDPDSKTWVDDPPVPVDYRAVAEDKRSQLLSQANVITADWRTELALGMLSEDDEARLKEWMLYIKAVKVIDVSGAPDIDWPVKPAA